MRQPTLLLETKISLSENPPIWRRVILSENSTFFDLHQVIQDSMRWSDYHLFEFQVLNPITGEIERLGIPDSDSSWDGSILDAAERSLAGMLNTENRNATYIYDFGDYWVHKIEVERAFPNKPFRKMPICTGGEGICPKEDSGGLDNYDPGNDEFEPRYIAFRELPSKNLNGNIEKQRLWLRKLLQCQFHIEDLIQELSSKLEPSDIERFYSCIRSGDLRHRNRAMGILAYYKGIPKDLLRDYLYIPATTIQGHLEIYRDKGLSRLVDKGKRISKYSRPEYSERLIEILHSPPSDYGYNRTSWRQQDIKEVMNAKGLRISKGFIKKLVERSGFKYYKARKSLTSTDPEYREKVDVIKGILRNLANKEKFFSIDEYGPIAIKLRGGKSLSQKGIPRIIPQWQKSKGSIIVTAALELSTNQLTYFYSDRKNTAEMMKLLDVLLSKYKDEDCIYLSWDAASWHISKELYARVDELNLKRSAATFAYPRVKLAPLPSGAQFLNVIESVFSGMARAIIHNSDYSSVIDCKSAIDKYISDRNAHFKENPRRAGNRIWGKERVKAEFKESNTCKDPMYR